MKSKLEMLEIEVELKLLKQKYPNLYRHLIGLIKEISKITNRKK